ncbi:stalk domain-containing protein [Desulfofalx alkaliphila]|uniref:stalk domain-containing protein n=1 Tax=Desulfofalx alkaliphila TaxID=105483 RepID=UPI00146FB50F|nr:stalk domain-containing protein [Desulfofalx alkaliphila]
MSTAKVVLAGFLALFLLACPLSLQAEEPALRVLAGSGIPEKADGPPQKAGFNTPYGLAMDSQGRIYVADCYNNSIRVIANGMVGTAAGSSKGTDFYGFPLGGLADGHVDKAIFNKPRAVVVDGQGTIYVADTGNNVIRKISQGKVTTYAGTGKAGFRNGSVREAQFNAPSGLALDKAGNLYVADTLNNVIRQISPQGFVTTYAGKNTGEAGYRDGSLAEAEFNEPAALAMDSQDNLYIADSGNQLIRKIVKDRVETVAGTQGTLLSGTNYIQGSFKDGSRTEAAFNFPKGITVLENGTLIIADTWNSRIRAVLNNGQVITLVGTGENGKAPGPLYQAVLGSPVGVAYYNKNLYIADADNNLIWQMPLNPTELKAIPNFASPSEEIQLWVNGVRLELNANNKPYIQEGRTILPLRAICQNLGCRVDWTADGAIIITKGNWQKVFTARDPNLQNNNGYTMVGLRYLAESMGYKVEWVPKYRAVTVTDSLGVE